MTIIIRRQPRHLDNGLVQPGYIFAKHRNVANVHEWLREHPIDEMRFSVSVCADEDADGAAS